MPSPLVTLFGSGAVGIQHPGEGRKLIMNGAAQQPVRLGRMPADPERRVPLLSDFLPASSTWKPPTQSDWSKAATRSIGRMYANDRYGCCVISSRAHSLGLWTANDSDSGGEVQPTDNEVVTEYRNICGPGDNGCVITRVLDTAMRRGLNFAGKPRRIAGYVRIDNTDAEQVRAAQHLFGAVCFGINFRQTWSGSSVWDAVNSQVVGGHDVSACGYDPRGVVVMSWGRTYLMTWAAITGRAWTEEAYAVLSPDWTGSDKLAPSGLDVEKLAAALARLGAGALPDDPAPPPPPPPPPPVPIDPTPTYFVMTGTGKTGTGETFEFVGRSMPVTSGLTPDRVVFDVKRPVVRRVFAALLDKFDGVEAKVEGETVVMSRSKLSPDQWAALVAALSQFLLAILGVFGGGRSGQDLAGLVADIPTE